MPAYSSPDLPVPFDALPHSKLFLPGPQPPPRPNTDPRCNIAPHCIKGLPRVSSTLVRSAWEYHLKDYPDKTFVDSIMHIIDFGADIGFSGTHYEQSCRNLRSAIEFPESVSKAITTLVISQHALGPFPAPPYLNFRCSPLGSVTRPRKPLKRRLIHHLSWPHGTSVNDGIADAEGRIHYEAFDQAVSAIAKFGKGTLLAKLDLKEAFHHIPVRPADWPLLGFQWQGAFYHAIVLTFGLKSAPYIFNLFAEALHWIIQRHIPGNLKHYLDDFLPIFPPSTSFVLANQAIDWIQALGNQLGLCFQDEKTLRPSTQVEFLGLDLDTIAMEARLPDDKLLYLRDTLLEWLDRRSCSLLDLQQLVGYLQFCSQVIPHSRAFLRRLINFSCSFTSPYTTRHIPNYVRSEIRWWHTYAFLWNGVHLIAQHHDSVHVFTDASGKKGLGGIFGTEWFSSRVPRRFRERDIQFKELYAVLQAILRWGHKWVDKHVVFHIDNQVDVRALENDTNRSPHVMTVLRMIVMLAAQLKFSYSSSWLSSSANALADCASRFMYTSLFSLAPHLHRQPTSPHPQTVGIRRMLMSQGLQHSGCGTASLPAHASRIPPGSAHSSNLSLPTPTSDKPPAPSCLQVPLPSSNGLHTLVPVAFSPRQLSLISPTSAPCMLTTTSLSKHVSHRSFGGWSAVSKGIWGKRAGNLSYPLHSLSSDSWSPSTQHHPASVISTTPPPSVLQSLRSYDVVNSRSSEHRPSTRPSTSRGAARVSTPHSNLPAILCSPSPHLRLTHSGKAPLYISQLPQDPPHAPSLASSSFTLKTPDHWSHPYSWGMTAPPSSTPTSFSGCVRT